MVKQMGEGVHVGLHVHEEVEEPDAHAGQPDEPQRQVGVLGLVPRRS